MKMRGCVAVLLLILGAASLPAQTVVVNGASFEEARPVAPGAAATIFGNFPGVQPTFAEGAPLPERINDVGILLNGRAAGLYSISPTQINFQVPLDFPAGPDPSDVSVEVRRGDTVIETGGMQVRVVSPAIFLSAPSVDIRPAVAQNPDGALNSEQSPVRPGETLRIFLSGQGRNLVGPAGTETSPVTAATPLVHFRTWKGETAFSGLLTGIVGLWVVDVKVPEVEGLEDGATPLTVTLEGRTSNTASVWVDW